MDLKYFSNSRQLRKWIGSNRKWTYQQHHFAYCNQMNCNLKICWANHLLIFRVDWSQNIPKWIPSLTRNERNHLNCIQRNEYRLHGMTCQIADSMDDFGTEVRIATYIVNEGNRNRHWLHWKIKLRHQYHVYTTSVQVLPEILVGSHS